MNDLDRFARQQFLNLDEVRRAFELSLGICQEKEGNMSKVIFEGVLSSWQSSPLHVGISVNDPALEGDFAALSGRRVRVTVEAIEPEVGDRLAGCKCKECGGPLSVRDYTEGHTYIKYPYVVWCKHCNRARGSYAESADAAIDAYLAAQKVEPRCPHCGGKVYITQVLGNDQLLRYMAGCNCGAHGEGPTRQAALDALAEYLAPCPRCGGKAEYVQFMSVGRILAKCACGLQSPVFTDKPKTAQWWNKREAQHG
jgi:hypothetical protein